jgi:hypothetical protein
MVCCMLLSSSFPMLGKIFLSAESGTETNLTYNLLIWALSGLIAGLSIAVICVKNFSEAGLIKIMRNLLIVIIILAFLVYIATKISVH